MVKLKNIYRNPVFDPEYFRGKNSNDLPFPFQEDGIFLFGYGRAALYEGLRVLGIKDGETVLVPDYICNVVVAPMHALNIKIRFYPVDANLKPQWQAIEKAIDGNTKALVVVNYCGFPNDLVMAECFCKKHNIYLIEDNAHGFLSADNEKPLGSYGDIGIFSFRKILPIPNGAGLLINNKSLHLLPPQIKYLRKKNRTLRFIAKNFFISFKEAFGVGSLKEEDFEVSRLRDVLEEYNLEKYFVKFSRLSEFIIEHIDFKGIMAQRRDSYMGWLNYFAKKNIVGLKVIFPTLHDNCVPFSFPLLVNNQKEFIVNMLHKGIDCYPWPYLPKASQENYFTRRMIFLPVFPYSKLNIFFKNG